MVFGVLSSAFSTFGAVVGICEGVTKAALGVLFQPSDEEKEPELLDIEDLQNLLEKLQLTAEGSPEPVLQACVRSWLSDKRDGVAHIVTIIELVFVVAIKRSGKSALWAVQYARLCSHLKAAAQPLRLDDTVQDALYGRSTEEYCKMTFRTVTVDRFGRQKHADQVSQEAAELRGSLRFMACLFKEHLLPITFIHALVLDFLSHAQAEGQRPVHSRALVALGLVSALQCCADAYVCSEALRGGGELGGAAAAEAHIRAISLALLRLAPRIDPFDDMRADIQELQFKLTAYSSSLFSSGMQQHYGPRRSEDFAAAFGHRAFNPLRAAGLA